MPAQPAWFHRLEQIGTELQKLDADYLDRHAIERIFGVRQRRARQLMAGLPCLQIGNAIAVSRRAILDRIEAVIAGEDFRSERSRRTRVAEKLETLRKHAAARQVVVPARAAARECVLGNLSPDIHVQSGELRISFDTAEDLAAKLFELSQTMANDWNTFQQVVERDLPPPRDC